MVKANGVVLRTAVDSSESCGDGLLTYKRRRDGKVLESGKSPQDSVSRPTEKSMKHLFDQAQCYQNGSHVPRVSPNDCSRKQPRNIILEQISESIYSEGGLKKCIQNALVSNLGSGCRTSVKEYVHSCGDWSKCPSQNGTLHGVKKASESNAGITQNGYADESKHCTFTELCQRTFSDIIMSEKFTQLCGLLHENFQGLKPDKVFNLNHINSRMKENAYESSPLLFQSDIREIWRNLEKVGSDIIALAKCLSDESVNSFREQVGNSAHSITQDGKYEFPTQESDTHPKPEQTDSDLPDEAHTCRRCRRKTDVNNALICDSCEGMYHISCTEPKVEEIPTRNWYCADCTTARETESSHENCVACDRLINSSFNNFKEDYDLLHDETTEEEITESSNEYFSNEEDNNIYTYTQCNVCRNEVRHNDEEEEREEYRICGHSFCRHKFYHVKCLSGTQLTSYGPRWYCPSCLCRACLTDRDDDKIVLCDGCDHAYHIYCMDPPRSAVPKGKWFCGKCGDGIRRLKEARRRYGIIMQNASRKRGLDGELKSGGVDMLLNAAKTLNYEENLALKTE